MSGVSEGEQAGRVDDAPSNEVPPCRSPLVVIRQIFKFMPDFIPSVLCMATVLILTTILQTESDLNNVKDYYSKLSDIYNSTNDKLKVIETLIIKMSIDCGVEDLEIRNVKDNRLQLEEMIRERIKEQDCVNNGMINWASPSLGATIIKVKGADTNDDDSSFLGIPCNKSAAFSTNGRKCENKCWTFKGEGKVLIRLATPIYITQVTVVYFPTNLMPRKDLEAAPKSILVKGYRHRNDASPHTFGALEFKLNGPPIQTFPVPTPSHSQFEMVEFQFRTNHGNQKLTCVHNVQVHGRLTMDPDPINCKS